LFPQKQCSARIPAGPDHHRFLALPHRHAIFLIAVIKIIAAAADSGRCLMELSHKSVEVSAMKSNLPFAPPPRKNVPASAGEERLPAPSRFIDEKISDESGTESHADSALKPTGLNNPFWN
jgi:hypothetical protein